MKQKTIYLLFGISVDIMLFDLGKASNMQNPSFRHIETSTSSPNEITEKESLSHAKNIPSTLEVEGKYHV